MRLFRRVYTFYRNTFWYEPELIESLLASGGGNDDDEDDEEHENDDNEASKMCFETFSGKFNHFSVCNLLYKTPLSFIQSFGSFIMQQ